jgi:hypothetical protein
MSGFTSILLGTTLAKSPGVQLAVDLSALVAIVIFLAVAGVTSLAVWILLPTALLIFAVVRAVIVSRRARDGR